MPSVPVKNQQGQQVGTIDIDLDELAPRISRQLLHDVVVMYETNRRLGTVRTKSRGDVAGSTKKMYRQKGTGRARMGPKRTPVRRGGGHAFAKRPVDYHYRLPKKAIRLATRMALRSKFEDDQVVVLDRLTLEQPKTKIVAALLKALGLNETTCLLAIEQHDPLVWRSARNIGNLWVAPAGDLNAYTLLHQRQLVVTRDALERLRHPATANGSAAEE